MLQSLWDSTGKTFSLMGSPHSFVQMSQSKGSHEAEVNFISFCLYRKEAHVKSHRPWIVMMNDLVRLAHCTHLRGLGFIEFFSKLVCSAFKDKPEQHRLFELCQGCPQDQIAHPHRQWASECRPPVYPAHTLIGQWGTLSHNVPTHQWDCVTFYPMSYHHHHLSCEWRLSQTPKHILKCSL